MSSDHSIYHNCNICDVYACVVCVHHVSEMLVKSCQLWPLDGVSPTGEFWLGLRKIHSLVAQGNSVLHIQLEDWKQGRRFSEYRFYLNGPESNYTIHLTHLSGDVLDPMRNQTGMMFSTKDRDNDKQQNSSCAHNYTGDADLKPVHVFIMMQCEDTDGVNEALLASFRPAMCDLCHPPGGWWFNACGDANLNGRYFLIRPKGRLERRRGIQWRVGPKTSFFLKLTQISVHRVASSSMASSTSFETGVFQWFCTTETSS